MQIVEPYARLKRINGFTSKQYPWSDNHKDVMRYVGVECLRQIEEEGRVSHRSEDKQTETSWERFIQSVVMQHGDWSITEHVSATVEFLVDRGITHELVRHRLFSYTQESTRFVNYTRETHEPKFIRPELPKDIINNTTEDQNCTDWDIAILQARDYYEMLIKQGCTGQIARSVLPNALASKIIMTGNLRSWRHFFIMRTTKESHPQMRQVTIPLLQQFKDCIPLLYDDIIPEARQADNLRMAK